MAVVTALSMLQMCTEGPRDSRRARARISDAGSTEGEIFFLTQLFVQLPHKQARRHGHRRTPALSLHSRTGRQHQGCRRSRRTPSQCV